MRFGIALLLLLLTGQVAAETVRDQEIAECRSGEIATWNDGRDRRAIHTSLRIAYRHANAPPWFDAATVSDMVVKAARAWEQCGLPVTVISPQEVDAGHPGTIMVSWSEAGSRGNFGLADLRRRTLSLGPKAFALLQSRNPAHDARETLQMLIAHELGHFFGLMAHSRRCVDVLSYYHDGKGGQCYSRDPAGLKKVVEYRHILPTACDIQRCRIANGMTP